VPAYRMYCLDRAGKIESAVWIAADSDEEAIAYAREKRLPTACEVWDRNRLVAEIPRWSGDGDCVSYAPA